MRFNIHYKTRYQTKLERGTCVCVYALIYPFSFFFFFKLPFILQLSTARFENKLSSSKKKKEELEKYNNKARIKTVHARKFFPQIPAPFFSHFVIGLNLDGLNHARAPRFPSSFRPSTLSTPLRAPIQSTLSPPFRGENLMNLSRQ